MEYHTMNGEKKSHIKRVREREIMPNGRENDVHGRRPFIYEVFYVMQCFHTTDVYIYFCLVPTINDQHCSSSSMFIHYLFAWFVMYPLALILSCSNRTTREQHKKLLTLSPILYAGNVCSAYFA